MTTVAQYPTRALQCKDKLKEMRRRLFKRSWETREAGGVVVATQRMCHALIAGLGPFGRRLYGPYFGKAMRDPNLLVQYHEVADAAGFPRGEMCSSMHHYIGELLLGLTTRDPVSGAHKGVDFVFEMEFCHSVAKTAQLASEILGVPHFMLDIPQDGSEQSVRYVADQMAEAIEWMVGVTGKDYHDEILIESAQNWWEQGALWSRICYATRAVPAPLDFRMLHDLNVPALVSGHEREVVEFYEEALAEVEERIREGIAACEFETCRLAHEGEPMWYAEEVLREIAQRFGAVFIGGFTPFSLGLWEMSDNGQWVPGPRFRELGITLRSREDALDLLARYYVQHMPLFGCLQLQRKSNEYVRRAQDWHCNGVVMHLDIGCRSQAAGMLEARTVLEEAGIPTVAYEASNGDPRDFAPHQVTDRLESFLERLGLSRLS